ncbi:protein LONGIFOLIA 1-like [Tasmannia lanceolata]|uniref:protein LONGIFOLIA 1-like n=1 Tax=Tasmannia lanceolata TaxID=3420 RepID=UPI00406462D9
MSAKILEALTDENPDLKKQIGCITGIFQLFDRHHLLTAKRLNGQNHKKLPSGRSHVKSGNFGAEAVTCSPQTSTEKSLRKNPNEDQRTSIESSRASLSSSSCSSSFSSLDYNKPTQPETPFFERTTFPEKSIRNSHKFQNSDVDNRTNKYAICKDQTNNSARSRRPSLDIRDIVKDSIYRETHGLSVKTTSRDERVNNVLKRRDSPRPLHLSKSLDGSYGVTTNGKDVSLYSCEAKDVSLYSGSKDAPRFSFDGRERPRSSLDSRDTCKSTTKLRELPRLSLDSRECSMKSSNFDSKSNPVLKDLRRSTNSDQKNYNNGAMNPQELESNKRHPSVVAKLMGLEALPNSSSATQGLMGLVKTHTEESKPDRTSQSPKRSLNDPVLLQLRSPASIAIPISLSKFPIETAPWRQQDSGRRTQKTAFRNREANQQSPTSQSVYIEIEKRLKELEFQQSNKDLRALKQILDAMQAKGLLESKKDEDQASQIMVQKNFSIHDQNMRSANRLNPLNNRSISAPVKGNGSTSAFESPIVIMKPAKFLDRPGIPSGLRKFRTGDYVDSKKVIVNNRVATDVTPKLSPKEPANRILTSMEKKTNGRNEENSSQKPQLRSTQSLSRTQQIPREDFGSPSRSSGSLSPRTQQRKLESEKRSRPPIPLSDLSKPRRQSVKQQSESGSPGGRQRLRSARVQQIDDQLSEFSNETRNSSHQGDEISLRSDSNVSLASQTDIEVTSVDRSVINCAFFQKGSQSPCGKVGDNTVSSLRKKSLSSLSKDSLSAEFTMIGPEQPSPISVLDASFYKEDLLPSPVKRISNAFKDDETRNPNDTYGEDGRDLVSLDPLSNKMPDNFSSEINHKKLKNITTDHIASICQNMSPDHRYVSEILLASGVLLIDFTSSPTQSQLHPSGHPINPDLFFVLEQTTKHGNVVHSKHDREKVHRKLIFDTVNEILTRKLVLVGQVEPWLRPDKLTNATQYQLLRELFSEIDRLQAYGMKSSLEDDDDWFLSILRDDMMNWGENLTDFQKEMSGMVLDVERLIFKDLIDEIVNIKPLNPRAKPSMRRRQLFGK